MARKPKTNAPQPSTGSAVPTARPNPFLTDELKARLQAMQANRQGPEDALGAEPTMFDYSDRLGDPDYKPHQGHEPQSVAPTTPGEITPGE